MKDPDWSNCTEEQLWKYVAGYLAKNGVDTLLVGGAVVAIYTEGASWEEAVAEYKDLTRDLRAGKKRAKDLFDRFLDHLQELKKCAK